MRARGLNFWGLYPIFWFLGAYYVFFAIFFVLATKSFAKSLAARKRTILVLALALLGYQLFSTFIGALRSDVEIDRLAAIFRNYAIFFMVFASATYFAQEKIRANMNSYLKRFLIGFCLSGVAVYLYALLTSTADLAIQLPHAKLNIIGVDFLGESKLPRLTMLGTYANSVAVSLLCAYFSFIASQENPSGFVFQLFLYILVFFAIVCTGSRICLAGMLIFSPVVFFKRKNFLFFLLVAIILLIPAVLVISDYLSSAADLRAGSTNMRTRIYKTSIDMVLSQSPILGMGFKPYLDGWDYPLGSHSSPIGYLFKNGIIGLGLYILINLSILFSIFKEFFLVIRKKASYSHWARFCSIYGIGVLLIVFCFEDMDGTELVGFSFGMLVSLYFFPAKIVKKPTPVVKFFNSSSALALNSK